MKVLVCGSRGFNDYQLLAKKLSEYNITEIIEGGSRGADLLSKRYGYDNGIKVTEVKARWDLYGKRAGYLRNEQMVNMNPDLVIAFWSGVSKGTKHTIDLAINKGIKLEVIYYGDISNNS